MKKTTETFCRSILGLKIGNSKALANLIMGLGSHKNASSVTALSESPCYHYQYSSIGKAIDNLFKGDAYPTEELRKEGRQALADKLLSLKSAYYPEPLEKFYLLNTDTTPVLRPHSPTLEDKSYVHIPNVRIKGNSPVEIGYDYSVIGLSARNRLYHGVEPAWNLPLSTRRLGTDSVRGVFTAQQVNDLLDNKSTPLYNKMVVNTLDSQYGTPEYIVDTYAQKNLVNVLRLKNNRVVWKKLTPTQIKAKKQSNNDNRGRNAVYGEKYKLDHVDNWEMACDSTSRFGIQLSNGTKVTVQMDLWEDMMIRTKRGKNMANKPFRLINVQLLDPHTEQPIYKKKMWLVVWGKRRKELNLEEIFWSYRNRFDIEHFFRFGKQRLLLGSFQTPDIEHLDNWMEIVSLAYWLLWVAKDEAEPIASKWQKYDPYYKNRLKYGLPPSPSEVQKQLETIILEFDQEPFIPKVKIKSKGRRAGQKQTRRKQYKVVYKGKTGRKKRA